MYPDLSKVFDRDFIIGFFLPAIISWVLGITILICSFTNVNGLLHDSDIPAALRLPPLVHDDSPIEPINGRVVVRIQEPAIVPPPKTNDKQPDKSTGVPELAAGTVVAAGENQILESGERAVHQVAPGETIYFPADKGTALHHKTGQYHILQESDIVARSPHQNSSRVLPPSLSQFFSAKAVVLLTLASWMFGVLLMALNRGVYQLAEGYGALNPFRLLWPVELFRYWLLHRRVQRLNARFNALLPDELNRLNRLSKRVVNDFPDSRWVLPTRFGNAVRAFEVYSRVMYGFEAIPGWGRVLNVISNETRQSVASQKAQVDFWLNLWFLGMALCVELALIAWLGAIHWFFVLAAIAYAWFMLQRARLASYEWGESVKAAMDLGIPLLAEQLGIAVPTDRGEERRIWKRYSQAISYRRPKQLPELR